MEDLKSILKDIRKKLTDNVYEKEEHVRLSLAARLCYALGWNIWNPQEFYTEFTIKTKTKEGSVDIVLFHSLVKDKTPDVFIEVKSVGKLSGNIRESEDQLQDYNYYNNASITILTDGRIWRFYLSSASGTFSQRMFCNLDLLEDKESYVIKIFKGVLSKDRFVKDAVSTAETMLQDLKLSKEVNRAKHDATSLSDDYPDLNKYQLVQKVLKDRGTVLSIDEIKRLWSYEGPITIESPPKEQQQSPKVNTGSYAFTTPTRVFVIDKWFDVRKWGEVKAQTYSYVLQKGFKIELPGRKGISISTSGFRRSVKLHGNFYTDIGFNSDSLVRHCIELLTSLGFDPKRDFKIEIGSESSMKTREGNDYSEADHLQKANPDIANLYKQIKQRLVSEFGLSVSSKKKYIAFKAKSNVVDIEIHKSQLKIYLNIAKGELNDPKGLFVDVSNVGHWGNGDYKANLITGRDIDYIVTLIKQIINN